jgi:hypothetical protein
MKAQVSMANGHIISKASRVEIGFSIPEWLRALIFSTLIIERFGFSMFSADTVKLKHPYYNKHLVFHFGPLAQESLVVIPL